MAKKVSVRWWANYKAGGRSVRRMVGTVIHLPSLMSCKVASVQKIHRGHPRTSYFWNEKIDHQGRWNKHEVVSCSLGANWNWPERRGERDEEGEMWRTLVPLLRSIMLFYFLLMWQEHVVNGSYRHIHSAPNNTALLMSLLKNNTCTACLLEAREC